MDNQYINKTLIEKINLSHNHPILNRCYRELEMIERRAGKTKQISMEKRNNLLVDLNTTYERCKQEFYNNNISKGEEYDIHQEMCKLRIKINSIPIL